MKCFGCKYEGPRETFGELIFPVTEGTLAGMKLPSGNARKTERWVANLLICMKCGLVYADPCCLIPNTSYIENQKNYPSDEQ